MIVALKEGEEVELWGRSRDIIKTSTHINVLMHITLPGGRRGVSEGLLSWCILE